jgi:hypothetical protein
VVSGDRADMLALGEVDGIPNIEHIGQHGGGTSGRHHMESDIATVAISANACFPSIAPISVNSLCLLSVSGTRPSIWLRQRDAALYHGRLQIPDDERIRSFRHGGGLRQK